MAIFLECLGLALAALDFFGLSKKAEVYADGFLDKLLEIHERYSIVKNRDEFFVKIDQAKTLAEKVWSAVESEAMPSLTYGGIVIIIGWGVGGYIWYQILQYTAPGSPGIFVFVYIILLGFLILVFSIVGMFVYLFLLLSVIIGIKLAPLSVVTILVYSIRPLAGILHVLNMPRAGIVGTIGFIVALTGFALNYLQRW